MRKTYDCYNPQGLYIGEYEKKMKWIVLETAPVCNVTEAATAAVRIAKSYQMPVKIMIHNKKIEVPFKDLKTPSVAEIVQEYLSKLR